MEQAITLQQPKVVLLSVVLLIYVAAAQSPSFHFSARTGDWSVDATSTEVKLTWLVSGVTWSSPLVSVDFVERISSLNNGCWTNEVKNKWWYKKVDSTSWLTNGRLQPDQSILLEGVVMGSDGTHLIPLSWSMNLIAETSGAMSFNIHVDIPPPQSTALPIGKHTLPSRRLSKTSGTRENYHFSATDIALSWHLAESLDDEQLVGAGEQYSMLGLRGENFNIWTSEQGIGRGLQPITKAMDTVAYPCGGDSHSTYSTVPVLLSTRGYGLAFNNSQLINMDLTKTTLAKATVTFENPADQGDVSGRKLSILGQIWGGGKDVRSLLEGLTNNTGRMSAPPRWTQDGLIVGAEGGWLEVQTRVNMLLAAKVPLTGVWIQDWTGKYVSGIGEFVWWNWELDEERYPKAWFREMRALGIKVLTYINPFLTNAIRQDGRLPTVFNEAKRLGHLIVDVSGKPIVKKVNFADFEYGMVDVFKPETRKWWINVLLCNVMMACDDGKPLVHAWMHDYGEYFPMEAVARSGGPQGLGSDLHNLFPRYSAETARVASENFTDVTFFARSGDLRSPGVARMFWLGDQLTSYDACDGLQSALIGAMSGGLSGWTINHADIGAFTMIDRLHRLPMPGIHFTRDTELNVRWLELCVFINAMFRSHPGLLPQTSAQLWDKDALSYTKSMTKLFRDLAPYREFLFSEASLKGLPVVRHGILVEPRDPSWFNASSDFKGGKKCKAGNEIGLNQFFMGDDVLVAPALRPGVQEVHAYIPQGSWTHFWLKQTVQGPSYQAWKANLGQPVFFYRTTSAWAGFFRNLSYQYVLDTSQSQVAFV